MSSSKFKVGDVIVLVGNWRNKFSKEEIRGQLISQIKEDFWRVKLHDELYQIKKEVGVTEEEMELAEVYDSPLMKALR